MSIRDSPVSTEADDMHAPNTSLEHSQHSLKHMEEDGDGGRVKVDSTKKTDKKSTIDSEERYAEEIHTGHVSSVLFVCVTFILGVVGILFLSPVVLLVNNKEQLVNDLNDGLYAYYSYSNKVLGMQIGGNCDEETIECKFKTMSPMLKDTFERYGFDVSANEASNERYNVSRLGFPDGQGTATNASSLASARKNPDMDNLVNKVYSSRTGVYQDRQFYERLLDRFGLIQDNTLGGATIEDFDESFDRRVNYGDPRYQDPDQDPNAAAASSKDSQDLLDGNARGIYSLKSLSEQTNKYRGEIYTNLVDKANTHLSLACAFSTYGSLAENAAVRAKTVTIARFAMNYLAVADDIKAGVPLSGEIAVESMANKLIQPGGDGKNAMDGDTYRTPALGESVKDRISILRDISPLILLGILKPGAPSVPGSEYLKLSLAAQIVRNSASDTSAAGLCAHGMSGAQAGTERGGACWAPASMPLASYIGVAAGGIIGGLRMPIEQFICPGSLKAVVELVKNATRTEATATLPERLRLATSQEAGKFTSSTSGIDAQNAIFAGAGTILGDRAQSLGMRPASVASLTMYLRAAEATRQSIEDERRTLARDTPWDATNPYSFTGSLLATLAPAGAAAMPNQSWIASTSSLFSLVPASLSKLTWTSASALYTQPFHFQPTRLQPASICGIQGGLDAEINPDFACNVRYSMSPDELSADIPEVIEYMTQPHPDEAPSDVASRDVSSDGARGARMKQQAEEGKNAAYIDETTGMPNKFTEYEKFLTYCTNRYDPWGSVGIAIEEQDYSYVEDPIDNEDRRTYNSRSGYREKPDEKDLPASYYALGWGGADDQDWYTGKKCTQGGDMMENFRAYTMACGVLASMSGSRQCWQEDAYSNSHDDFYTSNNIIFKASS